MLTEEVVVRLVFSNTMVFCLIFGVIGGIIGVLNGKEKITIGILLQRISLSFAISLLLWLITYDIGQMLSPAKKLGICFGFGLCGTSLSKIKTIALYFVKPILLIAQHNEGESNTHHQPKKKKVTNHESHK